MVNNIYANAYKEVLIVINNLVKEDYEKIPKDYINFLENNCNKDYEFKYDTLKSFDEQDLLEDTKYILFGLFEKFGATELQKAKIKSFKTNYSNKLEKQKLEKYNPDDIFNKKLEKNNHQNEKKEYIGLVKYKEPKWYQKLLEKIIKIVLRG